MSKCSKTLTSDQYTPSQRLMNLVTKNDQNFVFEYNTDFIVDCLSLVQNVVFSKENDNKKLLFKTNNVHQEKAINKIKNFIDSIKTAALNEADFEFLKTIGSGAFGCIQLARCKFNNQLYAIKKQSKLKEVKETFHNSMRTEREILLKAKHSPWIVKLHFSFQSATHLFLVLDLHTGGDLSQLLLAHGRPFPESVARFYAAEVATAVDVLHRLGFIHGDLSPSNLLLDGTGHLVLADFGLSLSMDENTGMAVARNIGTLGYSPPEMFNADEYHSFPRAEAVVGRERDYWSLGVILYEMLYQTLPFWSASEILACERLLTFPVLQEKGIDLMGRKAKKRVTFFDDKSSCSSKGSKTSSLVAPKSGRLSIEAKSFIRSLLCRAKQRLGRGRRGFEEVRRHPFFASLKSVHSSWNFGTLRRIPVGELFPSLEPLLKCNSKIYEKDNKVESSFWLAHNNDQDDDDNFCDKQSSKLRKKEITLEQNIDFVGFTNSGEFQRKLVSTTDETNDLQNLRLEIKTLQEELKRKNAHIEQLTCVLKQVNCCQLCQDYKTKVENCKIRRETFI